MAPRNAELALENAEFLMNLQANISPVQIVLMAYAAIVMVQG